MFFRVSDAVFIESAYISGDAKMSVSVRQTGVNGARGGALGTSTVEALVGVPGGLFVRHRGAWNLIPWANVKSARLVEAPPEIVEAAGPIEDDGPGAYLRRQEPGPGVSVTATPVPFAPVESVAEPVKRSPGRPKKVNPIDGSITPAATERGPDEDVDALVGPLLPPQRDEMGVLIEVAAASGPPITCGACGATFPQGSNHVCHKVE